MRKLLLTLFLFVCFCAFSQTTYTWMGGASGEYSLSTNWNPTRTTPATNDILVFDMANRDGANTAGTITTSNITNNETIGELRIISSVSGVTGGVRTTTFGGTVATLNVTGDLTIAWYASANYSRLADGGCTINVGGNFQTLNAQGSSSTYQTGAGKIVFNGTSQFIGSSPTSTAGNIGLTNIEIASTSTFTLGSTMAIITGNLNNLGTLVLNGKTLSMQASSGVGGTFSGNGIITGVSTSSIFISGTGPASGGPQIVGTLKFDNTSAATSALSGLVLERTNATTTIGTCFNNTLAINGGITLTAGTLDDGGNTITCAGGTTIIVGAASTGTGVHTGSGKIRAIRTAASPVLVTAGRTVTVGNLEIGSASGAVVYSLAASTNLTINGTLLLNRTGASITNSGTINIAASGVVQIIAGSLTGTSPTYATTSTLTYNTGGAITSTSVEFPNSFPANVVVQTGTVTLDAAKSINGNLTINSGVLADGGFTITVAGNIEGTGTHSGVGKIMMTGSSKTISAVTSLGNLEINSVGTITALGAVPISGNLTINSGSILNDGGFIITVSGNVNGGGTHQSGTTITFPLTTTASSASATTSTGLSIPTGLVAYCSSLPASITVSNYVSGTGAITLSTGTSVSAATAATAIITVGELKMTNTSTIALTSIGNLNLTGSSKTFTLQNAMTIKNIIFTGSTAILTDVNSNCNITLLESILQVISNQSYTGSSKIISTGTSGLVTGVTGPLAITNFEVANGSIITFGNSRGLRISGNLNFSGASGKIVMSSTGSILQIGATVASAATVTNMSSTNVISAGSAGTGTIVINSSNVSVGTLYFDQTVLSSTNRISVFTLTAGGVTFGNNVETSGAVTLTTGTLTLGAGCAYSIRSTTFNKTTGVINASNSTCTVVFSSSAVTIPSGTFNPSTVTNISLTLGSSNIVTLNQVITISNTLSFTGTGVLANATAGNLTMANGSTISRTSTGTITTNAPNFGTTASDRVNILIGGSGTSGLELSGTTGGIGTLTVSSGTYTLSASPTVNTKLLLSGGTIGFAVSTQTITMAHQSIIERNSSSGGFTSGTAGSSILFGTSVSDTVTVVVSATSGTVAWSYEIANTTSPGKIGSMMLTGNGGTYGMTGISPTITGNVVVYAGAIFNASGQQINFNSTGLKAEIYGTVQTTKGNGLVGSSNSAFSSTNSPTVTFYNGSTAVYNSTVGQTISSLTYHHLIVTGSRASGALSFSQNMQINGDFTFDATQGGTATITSPSSTTLTFGGSGTQNLNFSGIGASSGVSTITYNNITINSGASFTTNVDIPLQGNLNGTGSFTAVANKLQMTGSAKSIAGLTISNLELTNAGGYSLSGSPTITGTLTLTDGALSIGSNTLTLNGTVTGSGFLKGGTNSNLSIGGSGSLGTLNFDQTTDGTTNVLNNITINRSSGTLALGNKLIVTNTYTPTAGTLTTGGFLHVRSTASNTATIAAGTAPYISGDVTVERYFSASSNRAWRLITPGVTTATTINNNWQEGKVNTVLNTNVAADVAGYGTHITGTGGSSNGFDVTQNNAASLYDWNQGAQDWAIMTNTNVNTLDAQKGYLLFVRGNRDNINSINTTTGSSNATLRAKGTLAQGTQTFSNLATANNFSLVTNPYAAPINWTSIYTGANANNFNSSVTIWDPNINTRGGFVTVNNAGVSSSGSSLLTEHIQSGQAFFIQTQNGIIGNPTLTIEESHKSSTNNLDVFRAGIQTEKLSIQLKYTANNVDRTADGVTAVFNNNYSSAVDGNDAEQIQNWDEDIALIRSNKELSIEARPLADNNDTLFIQTSRLRTAQGSYRWEIAPQNIQAAGMEAYLVDNFTNTTTPVSLTSNTVINFTVNSNAATTASSRFSIVFKNNAALPVTITQLKAYQKGNGINVDWTTAQEQNIASYAVEKSNNGQQFTQLANVQAKGNNSNASNNYTTVDATPQTGNNYYRIKIVEKDGSYGYTQVVRVTIDKMGNSQVTVYPNPIKNSSMNVQLQNMEKGKYTLQLINQIGQVVQEERIEHTGGSGTQTIQLNKNIRSGIYQFKLTDENGKVQVQKIVKE